MDLAGIASPDIDPNDYVDGLDEYFEGAVEFTGQLSEGYSSASEYFSGVTHLDTELVGMVNEAAEALADAQTKMQAARDRAQAVYGDHTIPQFHRAS